MMIDRFDEAFDPPAQPAPTARQYVVAPVGECVAEIVGAEHRPVSWRVSPDNPHGNCLSLRLRVGPEYGFVFDDLPDDRPTLRRHLAQAVGINVEACVPDELVGRAVRVQLAHVQTRAGGVKAVVKRWVPQPAATPQATGPRQPPRQRPDEKRSRNAVPRYVQGDDDIPF
jgi:hypothetical protein